MFSLSTCWNSHRHPDGEQIVQEAAALGFRYIELSHGLKLTQIPGLLGALKTTGVSVSSVHNFCPPPVESQMDAPDLYEFTSHRVEERDRALRLTEQTLEFAARVGAPVAVLHLGSVRMKSLTADLERLALAGRMYSREYTKVKLDLVARRAKASSSYLDRVKAALDRFLPSCERHQVRLGLETRSHFEQIPNEPEILALLDHYKDCPWIGSWHDFGHVQRKANLGLLDHAELLQSIAPRLFGCHIHDVEWPARDHRVPGAGRVDFDKLLPHIPRNIPWVWELSPGQKRAEVAERSEVWRRKWELG